MIAADRIDVNLRPFYRLLASHEGRFVNGHALAKAGGIPFTALGNWMQRLRAACREEAAIEGRRGFGYRLVSYAGPVLPPEPVRAAVPVPPERAAAIAAPRPKPINHVNTAKDRLAEFAPTMVEAVARGAFDQGETLQIFTARLIAYGWEVYRDLLATGERP